MDKQLSGRIDEYLAGHQQEMIDTLFALARIPSVQGQPKEGKPYGEAVAAVLDEALRLCREQGLETENIDYYCGSVRYGSAEKELGFVAHLDVVPAGDGWSGEPFEPFLRDGYAIGRGVRDNKNGAVCGLFAIRCIKDLGIPMRHALRLIFGCAEETGMDDLPHYLEKHAAPSFSIVPDTSFPVCHGEKGIYTADLLLPVGEEVFGFTGGIASNVVPDKAQMRVFVGERAADVKSEHVSAERQGHELLISANGITAHASQPQNSVSAIYELAAAVCDAPEIFSEKTLHAMRFMRDMLSDNDGGHFGIAASDEASGKLTCICGLASLEGGAIRMNLNIRYPVTHDGEEITKNLRHTAMQYGMALTHIQDDKPNFLPRDLPAVEMLTRIYNEVTGREKQPYVMGGGTYARHLPNAVAFGPDDPDEQLPCPPGHGSCHEPDECQSIAALMEAAKIYVHALIELDKVVD